MEKYYFRTIILNNALNTQYHSLGTGIKELHYFCLKIKKIVQKP
jgi:hypothetical protein